VLLPWRGPPCDDRGGPLGCHQVGWQLLPKIPLL
jgi:hypothetical protein